ncbi:nop seven associated protein [Anaeramoeba flamelloides]|uniref:Nop seven associated protein n=1 Tax=Anaeramoeba flamelloides TaxID=1746091 RepID=A0AAV7ZVT2_9EUKA|nr:nop seven associated protein [Anaeramoeba flamelloides]
MRIFVGDRLGIIKCVSIENTSVSFVNLKPNRNKEIIEMDFIDQNETQLIAGSANGIVDIYDLNKFEITKSINTNIDSVFSFKYLKSSNRVIVCNKKGDVKIQSLEEQIVEEEKEKEKEKNFQEYKANTPIATFNVDRAQQTLYSCGGKDNLIKVWDINTGKNVFSCQNLPLDDLGLRIPIWDRSHDWKHNSDNTFVVGTSYGGIRIFDTRVKRAPVKSRDILEFPVNKVTNSIDENYTFIGDTTGRTFKVDLRKIQSVNSYRESVGSIRGMSEHHSGDYLGICGLDRFLIVYDLKLVKSMMKVYLKTQMNCCLFSKQGFNAKVETEKKKKRKKEKDQGSNDSESGDEISGSAGSSEENSSSEQSSSSSSSSSSGDEDDSSENSEGSSDDIDRYWNSLGVINDEESDLVSDESDEQKKQKKVTQKKKKRRKKK